MVTCPMVAATARSAAYNFPLGAFQPATGAAEENSPARQRSDCSDLVDELRSRLTESRAREAAAKARAMEAKNRELDVRAREVEVLAREVGWRARFDLAEARHVEEKAQWIRVKAQLDTEILSLRQQLTAPLTHIN
jgi:hypothetical protein